MSWGEAAGQNFPVPNNFLASDSQIFGHLIEDAQARVRTLTEKMTFTIPEAVRVANVSRSTVYEEIRQGNLRAIKIGRATRIRLEDLHKWLDTRPAVEPKK